MNLLKIDISGDQTHFITLPGLNSIHPTFVQEMLNDSGFDPEDIYYNLKNLSTVGGRKYSKELISLGKNYYRKINKGNWEPIRTIKIVMF